jgi:hypothetical protein
MIMTGYEEGSRAYRLCNPSTNKVIVAYDVVFEEDFVMDLGLRGIGRDFYCYVQ